MSAPSGRFPGGILFFAQLLLAASLGAGLTLSPTTFTNRYEGALDLAITGLDAAGQSVVVEEFFDADASGTVSAPDVLLRRFVVTDGQVTSVGGQRNLNVAGDEDGAANGSLLTRLNFAAGEFVSHLPGQHVFRVSPVGSGFAPFSAVLTVTTQSFGGGGVSGIVTNSGGTPLVGAIVVIFGGTDFEVVAQTISGLGGAYALPLPPGSYAAAAAKAGFTCNLNTAPMFTVDKSVVSGQNIALTAAGRTVSGTVRNGSTLAPLPAVPVVGMSASGHLGLTLSDAVGNYLLPAPAEAIQLQIEEFSAARAGCLSGEFQESGTTSVTGVNLDHTAGTALLYGTIATPTSAPVAFARVDGQTNGSPTYASVGISTATGAYTLAALPAAWRINADKPNFIVAEASTVVNTAGSAVLQNLTGYAVTSHLRGQIRDDANQPVGNVVLLAVEYLPGSGTTLSSRSQVDANGNFDLGVFGAGGSSTKPWTLQLNQNENTAQYVSSSPVFNVQDGTDIEGITYTVYRVMAHLRGQVLDEFDVPVGGVNVYASGLNGSLLTGNNADGSGQFDLGLFAGGWSIGLSNIAGLGIIPQANPTVTIVNGVDQNGFVFRVRHTSGTISGTLRNAQGTGLANVTVTGTATVSGNTFTSTVVTAANGTYSFPVFSSNWSVSVDAAALYAQGYLTPSAQNVFVNTSVGGVDFVAPARPTYASYQSVFFTPAEQGNPAVSGTTANPSGDGIVNLLKYAFYLDPKKSVGSPPALAAPNVSGLPVAGTLGGAGGPFVTLTYRRVVGAFDLQYVVEQSTALGAGFATASGATEDILGNDGTVETVRAKVPIGANPRLFLRLRVIKP
ncbi:MAG: carboxypeptidase regulatory-like domain-containing protein [Verrucomicrobia bacterium]|nr:carboxypeptidase regulatory-like domain-containing protein [Verrucomicrobiota bacterium]